MKDKHDRAKVESVTTMGILLMQLLKGKTEAYKKLLKVDDDVIATLKQINKIIIHQDFSDVLGLLIQLSDKARFKFGILKKVSEHTKGYPGVKQLESDGYKVYKRSRNIATQFTTKLSA